MGKSFGSNIEYTEERAKKLLQLKSPSAFFRGKLYPDAGCGNCRYTYAMLQSCEISPF
jgi:hypothetical protein